MKLRRLVTTVAACVLVFGVTFGAYAMNMEKYAQGISAASYDSSELAGYADQIAALVNSERAAYGLNPVKVSPKLSEAANTRARELKQSFSHTRPNGTSCFTAISELGITYRSAAENIAYGQKSPESVMKAWMNSSGHRANILNSSMEYIGVGAVYNNGVYYWSQFFAVSSDLSDGAYLPGGNAEAPVPAEPEETTPPEPEVTTAPEEAATEPEVTTEPEVKPEPEVTTAPEVTPEPETTTAPEASSQPEPEVTTAPEVPSEPQPEVTTAPEIPSQPETEATAAPEIPCVTDCSSPENCYDDNGSISCTPETPCDTSCNTGDSCTGNQNSNNCPQNNSNNANNAGTTDCYPSGNCPDTGAGNQSSSDCDTTGNCPTSGNQNSSGCTQNVPDISDILSSITGGSSGSCPNNNSSNGNCFGDILSWIGGNGNSSANNSSGSCPSNNSSNSCSGNNGLFIFGNQNSNSSQSSGCPLTSIFGSMFN